jgi:hypothetical protein
VSLAELGRVEGEGEGAGSAESAHEERLERDHGCGGMRLLRVLDAADDDDDAEGGGEE